MSSQPSLLEKRIENWEGLLAGIRAGLHADVAEVMVKLPPKAQAVAFDILKDAEAHPWAWEFSRRYFASIVVPLIEEFIVDLRALQAEKG